MKISNFFRLVQKKIDKYDKYTHNPFVGKNDIPITIVWIENEVEYKKPDL